MNTKYFHCLYSVENKFKLNVKILQIKCLHLEKENFNSKFFLNLLSTYWLGGKSSISKMTPFSWSWAALYLIVICWSSLRNKPNERDFRLQKEKQEKQCKINLFLIKNSKTFFYFKIVFLLSHNYELVKFFKVE